MQKYEVTGMSCAACVARVEKAVGKIAGVEECAVSLLTNSMTVEGDVKAQEIISAVENAGYHAQVLSGDGVESLQSSSSSIKNEEDSLTDKESPLLLKRLLWSLGFLAVLMYFSMGHMMWGWPLPAWFNGNHVAMGLVQMILAAIIMLVNKKFFVSGFKGLVHGAPNMDTLVALGSGVSFLWSTWCLFAMTDAQVKGDGERVMALMMDFYFESAAMILTLITVGKLLEAKSKGRTTNALRSLMKLAPKTAVVMRNGGEVSVGVEEVKIDDVFVVRPGETVPVDGVVLEGTSAVNESALTGESIPVDKEAGSEVSSGTLNQSGFLKCRATRVGKDTTINQIIQMVSDASASKAPIAKIADKVSGVFVPVVISVAVVTLIVWLICGADLGYALARGISVLVISCPCALGLATPVAIMVGNGKGASNGILFKTAESLETTGKVDIVALDKTGTITKGEPAVTDIVVLEGTESELLQVAVNLESKSEHPLGKAVMSLALERGVKAEEISDFEAVSGKGLLAVSGGVEICGGNEDFVCKSAKNVDSVSTAKEYAVKFAKQGKTPLYFARDGKLLGLIAVADVIKEDSAKAVSDLQKLGIKVVMLTGDNQLTAEEIGRQVGVDWVMAGILPEEKAAAVRKLQEGGSKKVVMIGDGINDAPALTVADVGIAIGKGTDVAIDAADVVLVKGSLAEAVSAIKLSRKTLKNIKENLFWAFIYNIIGIPLAAGCYIHAFGWTLNPMFGAAAMSLSSFCVVTNALRLNFVKLGEKLAVAGESENRAEKINVVVENATGDNLAAEDCSDDEKENQNEGDIIMTKTVKIEGMMCPHCEAHVTEALKKLDGVTDVVASHEKKTAVVQMTKDVAEDLLSKAVTEAGYEYLGISE